VSKLIDAAHSIKNISEKMIGASMAAELLTEYKCKEDNVPMSN
jgi:hypothetical protein